MQRQYFLFSVILRSSVLVLIRKLDPRPPTLPSSALHTDLVLPRLVVFGACILILFFQGIQERSLVVTNITLSVISCWFSFVLLFILLYLVKFKTERFQVMWFFLTFKANFYKLVGGICSFFYTAIKAY